MRPPYYCQRKSYGGNGQIELPSKVHHTFQWQWILKATTDKLSHNKDLPNQQATVSHWLQKNYNPLTLTAMTKWRSFVMFLSISNDTIAMSFTLTICCLTRLTFVWIGKTDRIRISLPNTGIYGVYDVLIRLHDDREHTTGVCRKSIDTDCILHFESFHLEVHKISYLKALVNRIETAYCSTPQSKKNGERRLHNVFHDNAYANNFIRR